MLFKDTLKLKEYTEFTEVNFASVKLTIRQVEEAELVSIVGNTLYNSLNNAYTAAANESDLTDEQQALLDRCRMVIAPYVSYYYAPKAEIQLSDSGPRRAETAQVKTAYGYQVVNFREQKLREAEKAAESLLLFLETNKATYTDWLTSPEFADYRSLFIKTGTEFNIYFRSASPYRNYWAWRYKMYDVEEQTIKTALGDDLYDHLKETDADADGTFTDAEKTLLTKLKKAIAYFTVAFAVPFSSIRFDANGITVASANSTVDNKDQQLRIPANADQISQVMRDAESAGKSWLQNAIDFIVKNPDSFTDYIIEDTSADDCCTNNTNECLNGSFGLM
jgi:hypothetical protein